jgi:hypothetical protein
MKTEFIYNIEGAEKVLNGTNIESGDTIKWDNANSLIEAKSKANAMLKDYTIHSVWIYKFDVNDIYGDPICQYVRYKNEKWKQNNGW